jgi:hypothetical protein
MRERHCSIQAGWIVCRRRLRAELNAVVCRTSVAVVSQSEDHMIIWPRLIWKSLATLAVLMVSLVTTLDAQAGSRHGGHGGRAYGGHSMHTGPMQVARIAPVRTMRAHPAIAYTSRPYTVASYAPRASHSYGAGYGAARVIRYAAPVRQVRYVQYQPTVYHQATYSTVRRSCTPRPHCVC